MIEDLIPFYIPGEKIFEKASDCYQYDSEGKKYIDFEAGVWCANAGHNHPRIVSVAEKQIKEIVHHGYRVRNRFSEELAVKLHGKLGFVNGQSVFLSSGSEAVNLAVTIARNLTGRGKILKINNSFLSAYGFGQLSPENPFKIDIAYNDLNAVSDIDFKDISAFVLETGGASVEVVKFPGKEFVTKVVGAARDHGSLIIVNEVTTGFGRTGKWFGFMHYDIEPDIVVTAKGLGNGFPISAVSVSQEVAKRFSKDPVMYLQSHINDPLGCAVALEVTRIIDEENLVEKSRKTGKYFKEQLEAVKEKYPDKVKDVRGRGLILALEFAAHIDGRSLNDQLFELGFLVGFKANVLRFLPPLTIKPADIDKFTGALDTLLNQKPQ